MHLSPLHVLSNKIIFSKAYFVLLVWFYNKPSSPFFFLIRNSNYNIWKHFKSK
jgi:hypothetical protein